MKSVGTQETLLQGVVAVAAQGQRDVYLINALKMTLLRKLTCAFDLGPGFCLKTQGRTLLLSNQGQLAVWKRDQVIENARPNVKASMESMSQDAQKFVESINLEDS